VAAGGYTNTDFVNRAFMEVREVLSWPVVWWRLQI